MYVRTCVCVCVCVEIERERKQEGEREGEGEGERDLLENGDSETCHLNRARTGGNKTFLSFSQGEHPSCFPCNVCGAVPILQFLAVEK